MVCRSYCDGVNLVITSMTVRFDDQIFIPVLHKYSVKRVWQFVMILNEVCGAVLVIVASLLLMHLWYRRRKGCPPGPRGIPILGYLPFLGKNPAEKFRKLSKIYGPVITVPLGPQSVIVLNDYNTIQEALVKNCDVFSGRPTNKIIQAMSNGYGIILRDFDDEYKLQRKFCMSTMRGYGVGKKSMEHNILVEIDHFSEEIKSRREEPFDCQALLSASISNGICIVILGSRFAYDDEDFKTLVSGVNNGFSNKLVSLCVNLMMAAPALRFFPPFSTVLSQVKRSMKKTMGILRRIFDEHKKTMDPTNPRDFIDEYLIEMERRKDDGPSLFCDEQLFQTVRNLFSAGTETSASTIRWALLLFAHRPDIQQQFLDDVKRVIGNGSPSMAHRDSMPYVNAFIQELMRHRTLVPLAVPHATIEDTMLQGYHIAKRQTVLPNLWAVHHDPEYFENPEKFIPQRFIDSDGKFQKDQRVIPFSIGPRFCLGEQLAKMEIFLFLTSIVQRFEIRASPHNPLPAFNDGIIGFAYVPNNFTVSFVSR